MPFLICASLLYGQENPGSSTLAVSGEAVEQHFYRATFALIVAGHEGIAVVAHGVVVGDDGGDIQAALLDEVKVPLHGVFALPFELLDAEAVGADNADFLEV